MSNHKHTEGIWITEDGPMVTSEDGTYVGILEDFSDADAARVIACVNACIDLPTELLADPEYRIKPELDVLDKNIEARLKAESELTEALKRLSALEEIATAVEADIDCGRSPDYNIDLLRIQLIHARDTLGLLETKSGDKVITGDPVTQRTSV